MISLLTHLLLNHPRKILAVALGITLLLAYFVPRVELRMSARQLYPPPEDAEHRFFDQMKLQFGRAASLVVILESDNVFRLETLRKVRDLTRAIEKIEHVTRVDSLATAQRIISSETELRAEEFLAKIPTSSEGLQRLEDQILNHPVYGRLLVSHDGRMTVLNIVLEYMDNIGLQRQVVQKVRHLVNEQRGPEEIFITGPSELNISISDLLIRDLKRFAPLVILIMLLVLFLNFRSFFGFTLPLLCSLAGILWTFGVMGLFKIPLTLLSSALPPILIAVGCSYAVYLLSAYFSLRTEEEDLREQMRTVLHKTLLAIILCAGTTALGFFALWLNDILLIEQMGLAAMIGISSLLFMTTFVLPCLFIVTGIVQRGKGHQIPQPVRETGGRRWEKIPLLCVRKAGWIAGAWGLVLLGFIYFVPQLRTEIDPLTFFKEGAEIRQNMLRLSQDLQMSRNFRVVLEADSVGYFKRPGVLRKIAAFQKVIEAYPEVGQTASLTDFIKSINMSFNENKAEFARIPDSATEVAQYLLLYDLAGGEEGIWRYVSEDYGTAQIQVNTGHTNSKALLETAEQLHGECSDLFDPSVKCKVTGFNILMAKSADYLSHGILKGFGVILGVIFLIMCMLFRSIKIGLIAMIPNVLPILVLFGFMGGVGIPFNIGTCMAGCVALAMAVDDTIHFLVHYYQELRQSNHYLIRAQTGIGRTEEQRWAMIETWRQLYRPMATTTVTVICGFAVLLFSGLLPIAYFGILTSLAMIVALLTDLSLTPVLLISIEL